MHASLHLHTCLHLSSIYYPPTHMRQKKAEEHKTGEKTARTEQRKKTEGKKKHSLARKENLVVKIHHTRISLPPAAQIIIWIRRKLPDVQRIRQNRPLDPPTRFSTRRVFLRASCCPADKTSANRRPSLRRFTHRPLRRFLLPQSADPFDPTRLFLHASASSRLAATAIRRRGDPCHLRRRCLTFPASLGQGQPLRYCSSSSSFFLYPLLNQVCFFLSSFLYFWLLWLVSFFVGPATHINHEYIYVFYVCFSFLHSDQVYFFYRSHISFRHILLFIF